MKNLVIGDPHIVPKNIPQAEKLMEFCLKIAKEEKVDRIVLMGDLNHYHGVVRVEVQNFWLKWLKAFATTAPTVAIRGNHDQNSHQVGAESSLLVFKDIHPKLTIVEDLSVQGDAAFIPYFHSEEEFRKVIEQVPSSVYTLYIHQTVDGSVYEKGFYAPDGFSLEPLKRFKQVISGHIHSGQEIGNVWYVGTPKWDTKSDANQDKGIWIYDEESGTKKFIPTKEVVQPIYEVEWKEDGEPLNLAQYEGSNLFVNLVGTGSWIASVSKKIKGKCKIVPHPTDSVLKSMTGNKTIKTFEEFVQLNVADELKRSQILEWSNQL